MLWAWLFACYQLGYNPLELLGQLRERIYKIEYNNFNEFPVKKLAGVYLLSAFYQVVGTTLFLGLFIVTIFINPFRPTQPISLNRVITIAWIVAFFFFAGLQQLHRFDAFDSEIHQFAGKTTPKRIESIMGKPFTFAYNCSRALKKGLRVYKRSGVDVSKDPHMTYLRNLAYYFYPKISLRFEKEGPVDGILYYLVDDVDKFIPEDHAVACANEDRSFVLSVSKDKWNEYVY